MKIALSYRQDHRGGKPVQTYGNSFEQAFLDLGHEVITYGPGHNIIEINNEVRKCDLILEIDSGRDSKGNEIYQVPNRPGIKTKKAVYFIDSHGKPDYHQSLAPQYDYVFFAPWIKRDLFAKHLSATWLPNFTDLKWFGRDSADLKHVPIEFLFGMHGSKGGLHRADPMISICKANQWNYDVREVVKPFRHRWPNTGVAMRACRFIMNFGQKADSPNLRVMEAGAVGRTLLTDRHPDKADGMHKLFVEGKHYIGYERYTFSDLEEKMKWMVNNNKACESIADIMYQEVKLKHQIGNRVDTILSVIYG